MNYELQDLRAFVKIAEFGNFHQAADAIHLSQPALTRRMQKLEEGLGNQGRLPRPSPQPGAGLLRRHRHAGRTVHVGLRKFFQPHDTEWHGHGRGAGHFL